MDDGHEQPVPRGVPAAAGNAAPGGGAVLHPQPPAVTRARRGEEVEGELSHRGRKRVGLPQKPLGARIRRGSAEAQEGSARLRASLGEYHDCITRVVCIAAVNQEHRMVRLPCGDGNPVVHASGALVADRSGGVQRRTQGPLVCSERGWEARHGRREALDAPVQADPGLRRCSRRPKGEAQRCRRGTPPRALLPLGSR